MTGARTERPIPSRLGWLTSRLPWQERSYDRYPNDGPGRPRLASQSREGMPMRHARREIGAGSPARVTSLRAAGRRQVLYKGSGLRFR